MDPRIDLTLNRDFNRRRPFIGLRKMIFSQFPWRKRNPFLKVFSSREAERRNRLMPTGNYEERENTRYHVKLDQGIYCDCCGEPLDRSPWKNHYYLCPACSKNVYQEYEPKFPWHKEK